jgi:hypothetical protein
VERRHVRYTRDERRGDETRREKDSGVIRCDVRYAREERRREERRREKRGTVE